MCLIEGVLKIEGMHSIEWCALNKSTGIVTDFGCHQGMASIGPKPLSFSVKRFCCPGEIPVVYQEAVDTHD